MPNFEVTLEQKRYETVQLRVEAETRDKAEEKALAQAATLAEERWDRGEVDETSLYASEVNLLDENGNIVEEDPRPDEFLRERSDYARRREGL